MKAKLIAASILVCASLLAASPARAQKHSARDNKADGTHKFKVEEINASATADGEKIRGPRSIKLTHVNRIRYRVAVKSKTSFTAGPSLALPFIPQIPGGGGAGEAKDNAQPKDSGASAHELLLKARTTTTPEEQFQLIEDAYRSLLARRASEIQNPIGGLLARTKTARDATEGFVRESDAVLAGASGPNELLRGLPDLIKLIDDANKPWPDDAINRFLADLDMLEGDLNRISDIQWLVKNKSRVDSLLERVKTLRESVVALSHNNQADSPAAKFDEAQRVLLQWREIFSDAQSQGKSYFELPYVEAGCGFAFDQNKETEVILVKQDRLAAAGSDPVEQSLVTVVCSSPLSISGGFGMSRIAEREFVFVPSTKTVTDNGQTTTKVINRFGFKNNSSFRMIPLLLLNTRVYEWNDTVALHMSAGAGVDIKTGEAGTDVEFIAGPTISFKRSMFITTGVHFGRVPKLAGGFQVGQEVPEGIDQPPVEKAWKPGFIIAITYRLK